MPRTAMQSTNRNFQNLAGQNLIIYCFPVMDKQIPPVVSSGVVGSVCINKFFFFFFPI